MNLFKGMLYTQGYLLDPQYADESPRRRAREDRADARRRETADEQAHAQRLLATAPGRTRVVASCG